MKIKYDMKKIEAFTQIFLIIGAMFAFSYFAADYFGEHKEVKFSEVYKRILEFIFGRENFVSAQGLGDFLGGGLGQQLANPQQILEQLNQFTGGGMSMCVETKSGAKCQLIPNNECNTACAGECVTVSTPFSQEITNVPDACKIGTCQDPEEGTCLPSSPQGECKDKGGNWFDDPNGNVKECSLGCCILGAEVKLRTELECKKLAESVGATYGSEEANFDTELNTELACLIFAQREQGGACVFDTTNEFGEEVKSCKFSSRGECEQIGGVFDENKRLCSNPELNTNCLPKDHTSCIEGLDEVYWFDSCGNAENIFGTDETGKEGNYISKSESCEIGAGGNWLSNQAQCGNCNRLFSSSCGEEKEGEELNDEPDGNVVCRDLGCEDELPDGTKVRRENGESWCAYQTDFGVFPVEVPAVGPLQYAIGSTSFLGGLINSRSMGPPGSQFFRRSCIDGEVKIDSCQDSRQGICVEARVSQENGKEVSTASCRANRWAECVNYNPPDKGEGLAGKIKVEVAMLKCEADPDCFVKTVSVDKDFTFPVCTPKYPPGFNLGEGKSGGEEICGFASQTCPAIFVKEAVAGGFGGAVWVCKANCDCVDGNNPDSTQPSAKFVKEMSDLCMSLGDCGLKVNYKGTPGGLGGFSLKKCVTEDIQGECRRRMPVLSLQSYLGAIFSLAPQFQDITPKSGKYIDAGDIEVFAKSLGASSSGPLSFFSGALGIDELLNLGSGGGSNIPDIGGYSGSDLPIIGLVPGATALGFWGLTKTGIFTTTNTFIVAHSAYGPGSAILPTQPLDISLVGEAPPVTNIHELASLYQAQYGESAHVSILSQKVVSPAIQAFSAGLTGAAISTAIASLLIGVSGIAPGLGRGWTYAYAGLAGAGGFALGAGLAGTYAAGSAIPAGTALTAGSTFTAGANGVAVTSGSVSYTSAGASGIVQAGGTVPAGAVGTVSEGGAAIGAGATAGSTTAGGTTGGATAVGASPLLVVAIVILVIVFLMIILNWVFGVGEMKKVEVTAECKPWQPPIGATSEQCNKCGEGGFPCNEYACKALGANCALVGEHPNIVCEDMSPNDVSGPVISENENALQEGFESTINEQGLNIRKTEGQTQCLEDFQSVTFGIETNEFSYCKIGFAPEQEFDEIPTYMNGDNSLKKEHSHTVHSLDIVNYFSSINEPLEQEEQAEVTLYVKCQDAKGNPSQTFPVNLCVVRADWTAPLLTYLDTGEWLSYGSEKKRITVRANEPVEMRWSFEDKDFDDMENRMVCPISETLTDCWADIPVNNDEVNVYVRAKDHPEWSGTERESERNKNEESLQILIKKTKEQLKIESVVPGDGGLFRTSLPVFTVDVKVRVSGGHEETTACYFGNGRIDRLNKESKGVYTKSYEGYTPGEHTLTIECADNFGNKDERQVMFRIEQDLNSPSISRVYDDSGVLVLITNEKARCGFLSSGNSCSFSVEESNVVLFETGSGLIHRLSNYNPGKVYYIKCKDEFGNEPATQCKIITGGVF